MASFKSDQDLDEHTKPTQSTQTMNEAATAIKSETDKIPIEPPFVCHLANLNYRVKEKDLCDFFSGLKILNILLPRNGCKLWINEGIGEVEFGTRQDLLKALEKNQKCLKNRPVHITLTPAEKLNGKVDITTNKQSQSHSQNQYQNQNQNQKIPNQPPFKIHIQHLDSSLVEEDVYNFFNTSQIKYLHLPRIECKPKIKGYGQVGFKTRENALDALERNEKLLKGRPVHVSLCKNSVRALESLSKNAEEETIQTIKERNVEVKNSDERPFRIQIKNLDYRVKEADIENFFADLKIAAIRLPRGSNKNKILGHGQVDFVTKEDLEDAIGKDKQDLKGRPITILSLDPRTPIAVIKETEDKISVENSLPPSFAVYVNNLTNSVIEKDVRSFFHGLNITYVHLPMLPLPAKKNLNRGFADVEFKTREDLVKAIAKDQQTFRSHRISIRLIK